MVPHPAQRKNKRKLVWDFLVRSIRYACEHVDGNKRIAAAVEKTVRTVRYWKSGEKEMGAVDLLMAARQCKDLRSRIVAFLHIPDSRLHRAEAEIAEIEMRADVLADGARATMAQRSSEVGGWRRARLSTLKAAAQRLRFRRRAQEAV